MARKQPGALIRRNQPADAEPLRLSQDVTTLGRSETCSVIFALPTVSRLHARIELQHDRYMLFDAGSANGTFVNGERLTQGHQLHTHDEIWLGTPDVALTFYDPEETIQVQLGDDLTVLAIDEAAREVCVYGREATLTPLEYNLLLHLATNPGTVCTRQSCFQAAWGQPYDHDTCEDALNACVTRLRRSLRDAAQQSGHEPPAIVTIPRVGFRLDAAVIFAPQGGLPPMQEREVGR